MKSPESLKPKRQIGTLWLPLCLGTAALVMTVSVGAQMAVTAAPAAVASTGAGAALGSTGLGTGPASIGVQATSRAAGAASLAGLPSAATGSLTGTPAAADAKATPTNPADAATKKAGSNTDAAEGQQPKAEAVKEVFADQTEFQRFVAQNSGRALPLYGYNLFAEPERYAPVLAAPVPGTYVLGPGDELMLQTYGVVDVSERLVIDRNGRVNLPKVGPLQLAGLPFSDAEKALNAHLGKVYTNFTLSLTMGRLRSIEVFVLGQAAKPGKHVVNGLSTLINALFETGGANANGSLRQIELRRGGKTLTTVDLYKFLSKGDTSTDARLQSGDVIYIPPAGERAAVLGTINAPAIYELRSGETIADILAFSGGLPALAAPQKAQLERLDAKQIVARSVEDFALDDTGLKRTLKAGDMLTVFQVSPQIANVVTLEGNVAAPMRYSFKAGMRVSDILSDPRLLIPSNYWLQVNRGANSAAPNRPEVNLDYATIQRLDPVTLTTRLLAFSPSKAMANNAAENIQLQSGDIISIYGPNQAGPETDDSIAISGEIVGGLKRFPWRAGMTLKDLIPSTQWLIDYYQYWQKSSGKSIRNDINWDYAQVTRRQPKTLLTESFEFNLGQQVMVDAKSEQYKPLTLQPGDQVALFTNAQVQVPLDKRIQFVSLRGEVAVPGNYQIKPGETLPQLIARAGGYTRNAYVYGTTFLRESTRAQQQVNLDAAIRRLEAQVNSQAATISQNLTDNANAAALQSQVAAQRQLLARMQGLKASGRIALEIDHDAKTLPALQLEDGDQIAVPHQPNFVGVFGSVLAETSFIHKPGMSVGDYIDRAGPTRDADLDAALLIRADGTVIANSAQRSWLGFGNWSFRSTRMHPGDSVFVPEVFDRRSAYTQFIQGAKDWTTILYQFALGSAAYKTLKN